MLSVIDSLRWLVTLILVILAKFSGFLSRRFHYGSGTALPGYLIERYAKWVLTILTRDISEIIFISGTNGKTTTRAIINHIYTSNGIATISNLGGANIFRGVASAIQQYYLAIATKTPNLSFRSRRSYFANFV